MRVVAELAEHPGAGNRAQAGTAALNQGGFAGITSVSCAPVGTCSAAGTYLDSSLGQQVFVVSRT